MTTKTKTSVKADEANSNHNGTAAGRAMNVRLEPISLRVRTAVKAGMNVNKASPKLFI